MSEFRREVRFDPAYDHIINPCSPECASRGPKSHGRHGVDLRFFLHGELGTTQFMLYTGWELGWVVANDWGKTVDPKRPLPWADGISRPILHEPMASDLGYHWRTELYEGCAGQDDCSIIGGRCFYDGSGLNAEPVFARLIAEGSEGVWSELEDYYRWLATS